MEGEVHFIVCEVTWTELAVFEELIQRLPEGLLKEKMQEAINEAKNIS